MKPTSEDRKTEGTCISGWRGRAAEAQGFYEMAEWNTYELVEFFGVLPEEDLDKTYLSFDIEKNGLRLNVTFFRHVSDVYIDIYQPGVDEPLFTTEIKNSPGMKYLRNANGWECLEIAAPHRYHEFFEEEWIIPMGARIRVNPRIKVEIFQPSESDS